MKTCDFPGCANPVFSMLKCKYHQYTRHMKGGDLYKQKPRKPRAESKKRKVDHIRYLDQIQMFIQENKDNGTYYCFVTKEPFDNTIEGHATIHHLRGRTGDYYLDKTYWVLARQDNHLNVWHGRMTYEQMSVQPWWPDFLVRLKEKDEESYDKLMRMADKVRPLNPKLWDDEEDFD
jgi:hypothetical protein